MKEPLQKQRYAIVLSIGKCNENDGCPYCIAERTQGAGYAMDYFCGKMNNRKISGYVEWDSDMPGVPSWCPIRLNTDAKSKFAVDAKVYNNMVRAILEMDEKVYDETTQVTTCRFCREASLPKETDILHSLDCPKVAATEAQADLDLRTDKTIINGKIINML